MGTQGNPLKDRACTWFLGWENSLPPHLPPMERCAALSLVLCRVRGAGAGRWTDSHCPPPECQASL